MNYFNYFTEIEEHFARRRGKHLLLSPMDWGLIASWRDAGVPLQVALRGIDIAMDGFLKRKRRGSSRVNSICYCHDSVMAEYASYVESRVGEPSPGTQTAPAGDKAADEPGKEAVLALISERIGEIETLSAKQSVSGGSVEGIERVQTRMQNMMRDLQTGTCVDSESLEKDLSMIDELLMAELRAAVPAEEWAAWEKEARKELKVYKKRLPRETYDKIHFNFLRGKIHKKFHIGELSLFNL